MRKNGKSRNHRWVNMKIWPCSSPEYIFFMRFRPILRDWFNSHKLKTISPWSKSVKLRNCNWPQASRNLHFCSCNFFDVCVKSIWFNLTHMSRLNSYQLNNHNLCKVFHKRQLLYGRENFWSFHLFYSAESMVYEKHLET